MNRASAAWPRSARVDYRKREIGFTVYSYDANTTC